VFPEYIFGLKNTYLVKRIKKLGQDKQNGSLDAEPPEPDNHMGELSFTIHKTVLRRIWKDQIARQMHGVCPFTWEQIWTTPKPSHTGEEPQTTTEEEEL
jgi:hypothetical protein